MQAKGDVLLIGNLTVDHNLTESGKFIGPGGTVYFAAKTFENLGFSPTIISPYGGDFPKKFLSRTVFYPTCPNIKKTLIFKNIRLPNGSRQQWVKNYHNANSIKIKKIPNFYLKNKDIVIVAPIINNIKISEIFKLRKYFKNSLFALSPQGFYRRIGKNGKVISENWHRSNSGKVISLFDIIVLSERDWVELETTATKWSRIKPIIVITREEKGCSLYIDGTRVDVEGFSAGKISDSTGAGDVFAASFCFAFYKTKDILKSTRFANTTATFSLRLLPNQLQYTYQDIILFAQRKGKKVKL